MPCPPRAPPVCPNMCTCTSACAHALRVELRWKELFLHLNCRIAGHGRFPRRAQATRACCNHAWWVTSSESRSFKARFTRDQPRLRIPTIRIFHRRSLPDVRAAMRTPLFPSRAALSAADPKSFLSRHRLAVWRVHMLRGLLAARAGFRPRRLVRSLLALGSHRRRCSARCHSLLLRLGERRLACT